MASPQTDKLDHWLRRLNDKDMPLLAKTWQELSKLTSDDNSPLSAVINIILQDPGMTARVLRLANSAYYASVTYKELNTISRAVLVLGINEIKSICMFSAIISDLLKGKPRDKLVEEIAVSFHAAIQAKQLAIMKGDREPEEIFVASLLYNFGEMAFLCFGGKEVEQLDAELSKAPPSKAQSIETKVLGFRIRDITLGIGRMWNLGSMLENALTGNNPSTRTKEITLSHKFVRAVHKGWKNPEVERIVQEMSRELGVPMEGLQTMLEKSATEAANIARMYGVGSAAKKICLPDGVVMEGSFEDEKFEAELGDESRAPELLMPDPMLQLKILRELASLFHSKADVSQVLQMVMEGVYRGVGMERVIFSVLTPDRNTLIGKSAVGLDRTGLTDRFVVGVSEREPSLIATCLNKCEFIWHKPIKEDAVQNKEPTGTTPTRITKLESIAPDRKVPPNLLPVTGTGDFFLAPIVVNDKSIGIIYADRRITSRELDQESYDSFQHFVMQGNVILSFLGTKKESKK